MPDAGVEVALAGDDGVAEPGVEAHGLLLRGEGDADHQVVTVPDAVPGEGESLEMGHEGRSDAPAPSRRSHGDAADVDGALLLGQEATRGHEIAVEPRQGVGRRRGGVERVDLLLHRDGLFDDEHLLAHAPRGREARGVLHGLDTDHRSTSRAWERSSG